MHQRLFSLLGSLLFAIHLNAASTPSVMVINYGGDLCGYTVNHYRDVSPQRGLPAVKDFDQDGSLEDEFVSGWYFSDTEPLQFPFAPIVDLEQTNAVFYGGLMVYAVNTEVRYITEGHYNANHGFRDDLNLMALGNNRPFAPEDAFAAYGLWYWKKEDFLNGGQNARVSFEADSFIAVHVSRYWGGLDFGRWVVRDGDQFYVSEASFNAVDQLVDANTDFASLPPRPEGHWFEGHNPMVHRSYTINPRDTRWAPFEPEGIPGKLAPLEFDPSKADFNEHEFKDVTAVGHIVGRALAPSTAAVRGGLSKRQPLAYKFYALRCDAVVERPQEESTIVTMLPALSKGEAADSLYLSKGELSYAQYLRLRRCFLSNQYPRDLGPITYSLQREGEMGSMRLARGQHQPSEPVTGLHFADAAALCNMLSEFEAYEPTYYADPEFQEVYRRPAVRHVREQWGQAAPIYWKPSANGYRLPTAREFAVAAAKAPASLSAASTQSAESGPESPSGHQGLRGNVWEYVWPDGASRFDPMQDLVLAAGGSYRNAAELGNETGFSLIPSRVGHYALGFRMARGALEKPNAQVALPEGASSVAMVRFDAETEIPAEQAMAVEDLRATVRQLLPFIQIDAGLLNETDRDPFEIIKKQRRITQARNQRFLGNIDEAELKRIEQANRTDFNREPYPTQVGSTEIPYRAWVLVRTWAESRGYQFSYSGDMGSSGYRTRENRSYAHNHPVTNISAFDSFVWCNALSELFALEPIYYLKKPDQAELEVYRHALQVRLDMYPRPLNLVFPKHVQEAMGRRARQGVDTGSMDLVFIKPTLSGFRVPLPAEFALLSPEGEKPADRFKSAWTQDNAQGQTQPVGTSEPNALGFHDLEAHVYEWSWDPKNGYTDQLGRYTLNGVGAFSTPASALPKLSRRPYYDYSFVGRPYYGLRVLRRTAQ